MGLKINTNIAAQMVQRSLNDVSTKAADQLQKISSGKRINSAKDDAAGLAIGTKLEAHTRSLRQAARNSSDGMSMIQTAEGGLDQISSILVRLRELGIQAGSDTIGETERGFLDLEYQQLLEEVDRISQSTVFNGIQLISGEGPSQLDFQVGASAGANNIISFDASETNSSTSGLGVDGTSIEDKSAAVDSLEVVDAAINNISGQRARLGALQNRLEQSTANINTQIVNQEAARSRIMDTDYADASAKLAQNNIIKNAGISALAQANNIPLAAAKLIG